MKSNPLPAIVIGIIGIGAVLMLVMCRNRPPVEERAQVSFARDTIRAHIKNTRNGVADAQLPLDPFAADGSRVKGSVESGRMWSIGPDRRDDNGALPYDATNGARSAGDVVVGVE